MWCDDDNDDDESRLCVFVFIRVRIHSHLPSNFFLLLAHAKQAREQTTSGAKIQFGKEVRKSAARLHTQGEAHSLPFSLSPSLLEVNHIQA